MSRIEAGVEFNQTIEAGKQAGINLVRAMVAVGGSGGAVEAMKPGPLNQGVIADTQFLATTAKRYYQTFAASRLTENFSQLEQVIETVATLGEERDFKWAGKSAESWRKSLEETRPHCCLRLISALNEEFNFPGGILTLSRDASDQEILEKVGAPSEFSGLRFLPGYRLLNYRSAEGESLAVNVGGNLLEGTIRLEKEGRPFFIGSTEGVSGLEDLLRRASVEISIDRIYNNLEKNRQTPFVLFDIDGTLRRMQAEMMALYSDKTPKEAVDQRTECFKRLRQRGIGCGLWSRNDQDEVDGFGKRLKQETGVDITPCLSFDNWPFLDTDESSVARYIFHPWPVDNTEYFLDRATEIVGAKIEISDWANAIHSLLSGVNDRDRSHNILEAKLPVLAGLWLSSKEPDVARRLFHNGVIVNNDRATLEPALRFGTSFIHVGSIENIGKVAELV